MDWRALRVAFRLAFGINLALERSAECSRLASKITETSGPVGALFSPAALLSGELAKVRFEAQT